MAEANTDTPAENVHANHRQRLRERFLNEGLTQFSDHNALELLLFYALPRYDTNPIAHRLLMKSSYDENPEQAQQASKRPMQFNEVFEKDFKELLSVKGIANGSATFLKLLPLFCERYLAAKSEERTMLDSTERAGDFFLKQFAGKNYELSMLACVDAKGRLIICRTISERDSHENFFTASTVMEIALQHNSCSVILSHNHINGFALPTQGDRIATVKLKSALSSVGISLNDHIIVADDDYVSFRESGFFN